MTPAQARLQLKAQALRAHEYAKVVLAGAVNACETYPDDERMLNELIEQAAQAVDQAYRFALLAAQA